MQERSDAQAFNGRRQKDTGKERSSTSGWCRGRFISPIQGLRGCRILFPWLRFDGFMTPWGWYEARFWACL